MLNRQFYRKIWLVTASLLSFMVFLEVPIYAQKNTATGEIPTSTAASNISSASEVRPKIVVKYVNQNNKAIAAEKTVSGAVGSSYDATKLQKTIKGYRLKAKQNVTGRYAPHHAAIIFKYQGVKVKLTIRDIDDWKNDLDEEQGVKRAVTGYYGNRYKISPLKSDGETLISNPAILTGWFPLKSKMITLHYTQTMNDVVFSSDKSITVSEIILGRLTDVIQTYPNGEKIAVIVGRDGGYRVGTTQNKYSIVGFKLLKTLKRNETVNVVSANKTQTQVSVLSNGYVRLKRLMSGNDYQTDGSLTSPSGHVTSILTTVKEGMKSEVSEEGPGISPTQVVQIWPSGEILTTLSINSSQLQVTLQDQAKHVLSTKIIKKASNAGTIFNLGQGRYLVYQIDAQKAVMATLISGNQYKRQTFGVHGAVKVSQGQLDLTSAAKTALKNGDLKAFIKAIADQNVKKIGNVKQLADKPKRAKKAANQELPATNESRITPLLGFSLLLILMSVYAKYKWVM